MIECKADIFKFGPQGEKTGWVCISIPKKVAEKLNPGVKKSFRIKGFIDDYKIKAKALLPMGDGDFILPLKADIRKALRKNIGNSVTLKIAVDHAAITLNEDLMACLAEEPEAETFFNTLAMGHRKYFSNWIDSAKTEQTKTKRIANTVNAMLKKMDYGQMIRTLSQEKRDLMG